MSSEIKPHIVVAACIVSKGYVLITQRTDHLNRGEWELPGGKVLFGEQLGRALIREIEEELDWSVFVVRLLHAQVNYYEDLGDDYLVLYYECLTEHDREFPDLPSGVGAVWIGHIDALKQYRCLPGTVEAISKVLNWER